MTRTRLTTPPRFGDVIMTACALLAVPEHKRRDAMDNIIADALKAAAHRKRTGRNLPGSGDGSLISAAMYRHRAREPELTDPEYVACLKLVLDGIAEMQALGEAA